jgi:hypothetical protein
MSEKAKQFYIKDCENIINQIKKISNEYNNEIDKCYIINNFKQRREFLTNIMNKILKIQNTNKEIYKNECEKIINKINTECSNFDINKYIKSDDYNKMLYKDRINYLNNIYERELRKNPILIFEKMITSNKNKEVDDLDELIINASNDIKNKIEINKNTPKLKLPKKVNTNASVKIKQDDDDKTILEIVNSIDISKLDKSKNNVNEELTEIVETETPKKSNKKSNSILEQKPKRTRNNKVIPINVTEYYNNTDTNNKLNEYAILLKDMKKEELIIEHNNLTGHDVNTCNLKCCNPDKIKNGTNCKICKKPKGCYNVYGIKPGEYCLNCVRGLTDLLSKNYKINLNFYKVNSMCIRMFCETRSHKKDDKKDDKNNSPLYCCKHQSENAISTDTRVCIDCGSNKPRPAFNYEDLEDDDPSSGPKYCFKCSQKYEGMVNVNSAKCQDPECTGKKQAIFGIKGTKTPLRCFKHKGDMVGVRHLNNNCLDCGATRVCYNYPTESKGKYCKVCSEKYIGMVDVENVKCITCNIKRPSCDFPNYKGCRYCPDCSRKMVLDSGNTIIMVTKYKNYCDNCNIKIVINKGDICMDCKDLLNESNTEENKIKIKRLKVKERSVIKFIQETYPELNWIYDKPLINGTTKCRPDILLVIDNKVIIVEIDEEQHKTYEYEEDANRTNNIYTDITKNYKYYSTSEENKFKTLFMIRFNPDNYVIENNGTKQNIPSCWQKNNKDGFIISSKHKNNYNDRLNKLKETIDNCINDNEKIGLNIIYLFYNTIPINVENFYKNKNKSKNNQKK